MCGRINVSDNEGVRLLLAMLGMKVWPSRDPRFNIAPSQTLDVITWHEEALSHQAMKWGMVPAWAKPGMFKTPLINARSETIHEKPSFKHLIKAHRILLPINGFYEWKRDGKIKTPYYVKPASNGAMFVGGLFQPDPIQPQFSVVTVPANDEMNKIHHRMPVILKPDDAFELDSNI